MKREMARMVCDVALAVAFLAYVASMALGAGGGPYEWWTQPQNGLGGSFNIYEGLRYDSSSYNGSDWSSAHFWLQMDPDKYAFSNANWNFQPNSYDPNSWTANCYLSGYREMPETGPAQQNWGQRGESNGHEMNANLSFYNPPSSGNNPDPMMNFGGSFGMADSVIYNTSFSYNEGFQTMYLWSGSGMGEPTRVTVPTWDASFWVSGSYLPTSTLSTPEEQIALLQSQLGVYANGAGTTATPEPSTWAMMLTGISGLGIAVWRRKRRV